MYGIDKNIIVSNIKQSLGDLYEGTYITPYDVRPLEKAIDYQFYIRDTTGVNYDIDFTDINKPFTVNQNFSLIVTYTDRVNVDSIITNLINAIAQFKGVIKTLTTDQNLIANAELRNKEQKNYSQPMLKITFSIKTQYQINYNCSQNICEKC